MNVREQTALVPLLMVLKKLGINAVHYYNSFNFYGSELNHSLTGLLHGIHIVQFTPKGVKIDGMYVVSRS